MPPGMRGGMPLEEAPPLKWRAVRKNIGKFVSYYRPHRGLLLLDMASGVSHAALTVIVPLIVYRVFQQYLPDMALDKILIAAALLLVLQSLIALTGYISTRWGHALGARMEADMRQDLGHSFLNPGRIGDQKITVRTKFGMHNLGFQFLDSP